MSKKLNPKKVLEEVIEAHLKQLTCYKQSGLSSTDSTVVLESLQIGKYITEYKMKYSGYTKALTYSGKLLDILN